MILHLPLGARGLTPGSVAYIVPETWVNVAIIFGNLSVVSGMLVVS